MMVLEHLTTQESVFDNLLLKGIRSGNIPARTKQSIEWFRNKAKGTEISTSEILAEKTRFTDKVVPGKMYFFQYYPKYEKTLKYWDAFPLIFPIEKYNNGFLGLNMHYLPHDLRAKLMDALYSITNNKNFKPDDILPGIISGYVFGKKLFFIFSKNVVSDISDRLLYRTVKKITNPLSTYKSSYD